MEIWKQIKDYPDYYISSLGNVKSLKCGKIRNLKVGIDSRGYYKVTLRNNNNQYVKRIHQLVAIAFLNHTPCNLKLVVNHKNFIKTDNRLENLEIITNRENTNMKHIKSSSIYTGVSWNKANKKWYSIINIKGKLNYLGCYINEIDAHNAYQDKLKSIEN